MVLSEVPTSGPRLGDGRGRGGGAWRWARGDRADEHGRDSSQSNRRRGSAGFRNERRRRLSAGGGGHEPRLGPPRLGRVPQRDGQGVRAQSARGGAISLTGEAPEEGRGDGRALPFASVEDLERTLVRHSYLPDEGLATSIHLALALHKPLLLEGEAGVGKTEVAKVLAAMLGRRLIRLQCYEGIDSYQALYEWNYSRQLIAVRAAQTDPNAGDHSGTDLFGPDFLIERPLLAAIRAGDQAVLLIDELDRADDEFEAFLLEVLSEFAVTIPEIGSITATRPPAVIITSNRTRDLHDALKRRCLYHWIDHPTLEREVEIVRARAPQVEESLARQVSQAVERLRALDVSKKPGVAETIDWAEALNFLGVKNLSGKDAAATLGAVVKDHEDQQLVRARLKEVVGESD
ncbi:MAG: MoxR family ATPase [Actinobacteria bacterium]|nr:MoxR family ATPase [Actinomycetota bacterium]